MATYFRIIRSKNDRRTLIAGADITKGLLVSLDSSGELVIATETATNVIGVAIETQLDTKACAFATDVLEVTLIAGAAVTAGNPIMVIAGGKVDDWAANTSAVPAIGTAMEAASADGDLIRCFIKLPVFEVAEAAS